MSTNKMTTKTKIRRPRRVAMRGKLVRPTRTRDIQTLLKRFPIRQDPSILPAIQVEIWDASSETPVIRRHHRAR